MLAARSSRKTRLLELALFVMQSLDGLDHEYEYSMVGHSGSGPEAEQLINWAEPPQARRMPPHPAPALRLPSLSAPHAPYQALVCGSLSPAVASLCRSPLPCQGAKRRLQLMQRMAAHAQYCHPGDQTFEATALAIREAASRAADERFVFVVSDADLARCSAPPGRQTLTLFVYVRIASSPPLPGPQVWQDTSRVEQNLDR